mmetsp:Transcript_19671/g.66370  ORF Transcript_19671/g.66370 Transcript_19671/m.66370 type:complete len:205 (+) Transcript_19671:796-1410(+)
MSYQYAGCRFAKLDVDAARDLAASLQVRAMPTFLLFGVPAPGCPHMVELDGCQGWDEGRVRSLLESHGVARRPIAEAEAEEEAIPAPAARRDPKKRRPATKARHHARLASRDARCYPLEGQEDAAEVPPPPLSLQRSPTPVWVRRPRKEEGASSEESGWRVVGKRGKPLRAKREAEAEPSPAFLAVVQASAAQQAKGKKKCSIM